MLFQRHFNQMKISSLLGQKYFWKNTFNVNLPYFLRSLAISILCIKNGSINGEIFSLYWFVLDTLVFSYRLLIPEVLAGRLAHGNLSNLWCLRRFVSTYIVLIIAGNKIDEYYSEFDGDSNSNCLCSFWLVFLLEDFNKLLSRLWKTLAPYMGCR